jgi:acyl-CoA synthetase (NDP forming)
MKKLRSLSSFDSRALLEEAGICFSEWQIVTSAQEAILVSVKLNAPLAVKTASAGVIHKTEFGCVLLDVVGADAAADAYDIIVKRAAIAGSLTPEQVLIEQMVSGIAEVVIGLKKDDIFGPVIVVGMGGVMVELFQDICVRLCPVSKEEAHIMLEELSGYDLLNGFRGKPRTDLSALTDAIVAVSQLGSRKTEIIELDINPIIALAVGAIAIDSRIIVEDKK